LNIADLELPEAVTTILSSTGINTLYPPQVEAIRAGALQGENLVLASPTASGKTLIAELCAIKHILDHGGKVLYLTPLRALTSEKYQDFRKYSSVKKSSGYPISIGISTGDYDSADPWLGRYDVIITTNEKCDSLLRHRPSWINTISLIVADEIHTIMDADRGPTLEVTLTRLLEVNPQAQILALSATIRNADEISEWLHARSITTDWRPVKLAEGVYFNEECQFNSGRSLAITHETKNPINNLILETLSTGGQALVFANTRRRAVALAKQARSSVAQQLSKHEKNLLNPLADRVMRAGEQTRFSTLLADLVRSGVAFHHAGLVAAHRRLIEDGFRRKRIKVIAATPTLAAGVNLPARTVIISSTRRYSSTYGLYDISVLEYKQMAGRAGRPRFDKVGEAVLLARTEDERDYLMERYIFAKPERLWSKLAVERILRSHVLASIASGYSSSEESVLHFFRKTFYAYQFDSEIIDILISNVLEYLLTQNMVTIQKRHLQATPFGRRVSELYIDPVSAVILRDGLDQAPVTITDLSYLHLVCHTPDIRPKLYPRSRELDALNTYYELHAHELFYNIEAYDDVTYEVFLGEMKSASVLTSWIQEVPEDDIIERHHVEPGDLFRLISSITWLLHAAQELAQLLGHPSFKPSLSRLNRRVEKGVKRELLPLVSLERVGRVRGRILFNAGFRTLTDLKRASLLQLTQLPLIGPQVAKRIKDQVGGLIRTKDLSYLDRVENWEQKALSDFK
jgi:helicase